MSDFEELMEWAKRPLPPGIYRTEGAGRFLPAPELQHWVHDVFFSDGSPLHNPEHAHLYENGAFIGFLWTDCRQARHMNEIAATASIPGAQGNKWARKMFEQQLTDWFEEMPDFLITVYGPTAAQMSDAQFCALIEHELLHCSFATDEDGEMRRDEDDRPRWAIRGHDVEEFVSIVARYGAGNAAGKTAQLVRAAQNEPLVAGVDIRRCCGTCKG